MAIDWQAIHLKHLLLNQVNFPMARLMDPVLTFSMVSNCFPLTEYIPHAGVGNEHHLFLHVPISAHESTC